MTSNKFAETDSCGGELLPSEECKVENVQRNEKIIIDSKDGVCLDEVARQKSVVEGVPSLGDDLMDWA